MARRKSRRSRRSSRRGLGCVGCASGYGPGSSTLAGMSFMGEARSPFKYALYAALAYFAYTKVIRPSGGLSGLGAIFTSPAGGSDSLNRPLRPGQMVEIPRGF